MSLDYPYARYSIYLTDNEWLICEDYEGRRNLDFGFVQRQSIFLWTKYFKGCFLRPKHRRGRVPFRNEFQLVLLYDVFRY
jgi:hypothetical protein